MPRTRSRLLATIAALGALLLLAAACGDDAEDVSSGDGGASGEGGDTAEDPEPVLLVELEGAFTTPESTFQTIPQKVVYADGRVIEPGAQILIHPAPALPAVQEAQLTDDGLDAVREAARDAGLDRNDVDYGEPPVADAGDTVVTVVLDGETYVHRARALGIGGGPEIDLGPNPDVTDEQQANREALEGFLAAIGDLTTLAGEDGVSDYEPYTPERYRLWVRPAEEVDAGVSPGPDEPEPTEVDWTVEGVELTASECTPVEGEAASQVTELLADADMLTRFSQGDETWAVVARPVLPHEPTCPDA